MNTFVLDLLSKNCYCIAQDDSGGSLLARTLLDHMHLDAILLAKK